VPNVAGNRRDHRDPARGTANLLAANLRIPRNLTAAVRVGLHGDRRALDTGSVNGEHFAVMPGGLGV
jgi:diacylglycerol kinase family enzyme